MDIVANPYENLPFSDKNRWVRIYPAYINSRKTLSGGRKISKAKAVDNPLCTEIRDVCVSQQLCVEFETNKHYPREPIRDQIHSGRVSVQIKNDDGLPFNENITSRKDLYRKVCELIPKLKTRQAGGKSVGAGEQVTTSSSTGKGGGSKKKGRR